MGDWPPVAPQRVTSLPSNPYDGQEIYYVADATNGVIWHLRYNAGSASIYKWEFVGGPPLTGGPSGSDGTATISYQPIAGSPAIGVPLAGDYEIEGGADVNITNSNAFNSSFVVAVKFGTTATSDSDIVARMDFVSGQNGAGAQGSTKLKRTITAPLVVAVDAGLRCQMRSTSASRGANCANVWVSARPIRVG